MPAGAISPHDLFNSPAPFSRATLDDKTGLIGNTATAVTQDIYGPSGGPGVTHAWSGAEVTNNTNQRRPIPRSITVTTAAHPATYKPGGGNALVVSGTYGGAVVTENLILTAANGGETIRGTALYDDPTQCTVTVPGQNDALGGFSFGVGDIGAPKDQQIRGFKAVTAGNLVIKGGDGFFDVVPCAAQVPESISCARICPVGGGATSDAVAVTAYL